jgi:hypothetical protein
VAVVLDPGDGHHRHTGKFGEIDLTPDVPLPGPFQPFAHCVHVHILSGWLSQQDCVTPAGVRAG